MFFRRLKSMLLTLVEFLKKCLKSDFYLSFFYKRLKFQLQNLGCAAWSLSSNWPLTSNKLRRLATAIFGELESKSKHVILGK